MHYVYVLFLNNAQLYAGRTDDLKRRIREHLDGRVDATRYRRPLQLIFYEAFAAKGDAIRKEKYLKTTKGKKTLKLILKDSLSYLVSKIA